MLKGLVIVHNNEEVALGMEHPIFGFIPVLVCENWDKFRRLIDMLNEYYDEHHPKIPTAFLQAFEEEENKC